jgi:hypothetical protein
MAFLQKTWKDRVAEYINRRVLTKEDGTTELVSVERSEGTISQEGDAFSAANMNDLEQRIANEFSEQNKKIVELEGKLISPNDYATGTIKVSFPKGESVSGKVIFDKPFLSIPKVEAHYPEILNLPVNITEVTTLGFSFRSTYYSSSVDAVMDMVWIASVV